MFLEDERTEAIDKQYIKKIDSGCYYSLSFSL